MKTIIFTPSAAKEFDHLPVEARHAVNEALIRYVTTDQGDVKQLSGRDGHRLRVGAYRVIFNSDATTILAIYIGRRSTTTYRNH